MTSLYGVCADFAPRYGDMSGQRVSDRKVPDGLRSACHHRNHPALPSKSATITYSAIYVKCYLCQSISTSLQLAVMVLVTWREDMTTVDWELRTTTWRWQAARKQANTGSSRRTGERERLAGIRIDGGDDPDGRQAG